MEALGELQDNIMVYLVIIFFGVGLIFVSIIISYVNEKYPSHGTLIELILMTPALILILILF